MDTGIRVTFEESADGQIRNIQPVNATANGVWLPQNDTISKPDGVTPHNQTFRKTYFDFLNEKFDGVATKEDALDILESIREGLESDELQFELAN